MTADRLITPDGPGAFARRGVTTHGTVWWVRLDSGELHPYDPDDCRPEARNAKQRRYMARQREAVTA